jgi:serine protease Do
MKELHQFALVSGITSVITVGILVGGTAALHAYQPTIIRDWLQIPDKQIMADTETRAASSDNETTLPATESAVIQAVKATNPAVVAITISKNVPVYERYIEEQPSPFSDFFGNDFFGGFGVPRVRQKDTELQEVGGGSGFLVSADGYIVTNRHVVADDAAEYAVLLNNGKTYDARVVARDPVLDLAVMKIDGNDFPYLTFGDSQTLEPGQTVIAIGNALGEFRNTVSVGVVSGLSRSITASDQHGGVEALDQLIQSDAAINPGNSGGPLLNTSGEVVGVNVAVAGNAENIGFALSANSVKHIVESVKKTGKIVRPYLGIRYVPITEELRKKNNLTVEHGVLVLRGNAPDELAVIPGSPADKASIMENDILLEIDGEKITIDTSLATIIRGKEVGYAVTIKLISKGKEKTVTVALEAMPDPS